ncbi:MAG: hypothetical protein VYA80_04170 [Pseudomonadota bacterium]|nr:hypothetical protein [Pseudomonadota bacterium]
MSAYVFPILALVHLSVLFWCIVLIRRNDAPGAGIIAFIAAALVYDNLIVSLGSTIGVGSFLQMLSWPRFALHALLTPFMMIAAIQLGAAAGINWAKNNNCRLTVWAIVIVMVVYGVFDHLIGLKVVPACFDGILRYTANLHPSHFCSPEDQQMLGAGPPLPAIVGNFLTLIVGFAIWRRIGWIWLMLGSLAMFLAAASPISLYGMAPSNTGEAFLMTAYVATCWRLRKPINE